MALNVVAKLAITGAMMAAQMALTAMTRIAGPRLEDLDVTLAEFGTPIPRFWGKRRFEGTPIIWAERLREVKSTSKTKGGKYDQYKYYGTWAVLLCDHEIDAVSRIWMDKHLCYQATDAGPVSVALAVLGTRFNASSSDRPVKLAQNVNMRVYLGTESQEADPRMEAWCEDRYGADSCPAYKGVSYIVFQDIPLEKFGNRIPQISVEAVNVATNAFPYETRTGYNNLFNVRMTPGYERMVYASGGDLAVWDIPTRTMIVERSLDQDFGQVGVDAAGNIYGMTDAFFIPKLWQVTPDGTNAVQLTDSFDDIPSGVEYAGGLICVYPAGTGAVAMYYAVEEVISVATDFVTSHYFEDLNGDAWALGWRVTGFGLMKMPVGAQHIVAGAGTNAAAGFVNADGNFVIWQDDILHLVDGETFAVLGTAAGPSAIDFQQARTSFANIRPGATSFWLLNREIDSSDLSTIRTVTLSNWVSGGVAQTLYDPISHALIGEPSTPTTYLTWYYLDRVGSDGVTLRSVVEDVADWCGVTVDATDLTQTVQGYSVTQGAGKEMIEPLLDIHDSDARPHDFTVQFIQRGDASSGTLATANFVKDDARYTVAIAQDTDIPRRITLNFADEGKDQQTNTVISQRPLDAVDSVREQTLDLTTYVSDPEEAQQLTDRYFRRQWNGRELITLGLTAWELALEPGDVKTLELDGVSRVARCIKMTLSGGAIQTEWERDFPGLHSLGTGEGADMEGRDDDPIFVAGPSKGFLKDIPLLQDSHDNALPQIYYGAGPYGDLGFPGAVFYETDADGDEYTQWNIVAPSEKVAWGYSTDTLDAPVSPWLWDRENEVNIGLISGSLTSVTEAQIDADPTLNMALLAGELINFTTATLEADGTYTISGFKRGRRGTENECSEHVAGDEFLLVANLQREGYGLSDIGQADSYTVQTFGRAPESGQSISVTPAGNTLKPYAPARLKEEYDGTDLDCTIYRRTRVGGAWVGGTTIPLAEASEEYEVDVYSGATFKRTITVTGTNTFTYTAAQAATDSITLPAGPTFKVYQMSDAVGRGFELAA